MYPDISDKSDFIMVKTNFKAKSFIYMVLLLFISLSLSGCAAKHGEELDINDLSGKTIGVMLGYSSDYILTDKYEDIDLRRFDAPSDLALALAFHQLDAAAMEMDEASVFCRLQPKYMIYGSVSEDDRFAYILNPRNTEINQQFNSFIAQFKQSDTYKDILQRVKECSEHPFASKQVENTVTGNKVLDVLVYNGWDPVSYINTETNQWEGSDIELITHFANAIGATVKFHPAGSYTQAVLDLSLGKVDIFQCPHSIKMKTDLEKGGNVTMSDWVWKKDIVFIVNTADYE